MSRGQEKVSLAEHRVIPQLFKTLQESRDNQMPISFLTPGGTDVAEALEVRGDGPQLASDLLLAWGFSIVPPHPFPHGADPVGQGQWAFLGG